MQVHTYRNLEHQRYGIMLSEADRHDNFTDREKSVTIELDGELHTFPLTDMFWGRFPTIYGDALKAWLEKRGATVWSHGDRPVFHLLEVMVPKGRRWKLWG